MAIPTGTITFLFTDIESSTRLWQEQPETMKTTLSQHDQILRTTFGADNGHIFKHAGDGFYAAFSRAEDAIKAAIDAQLALRARFQSAPIQPAVRMVLHTGCAEERDGDYFGPTLSYTARLLRVAHGGQVLLSSVTGQLIYTGPPHGSALKDLGPHRLPDFGQPEIVYQLLHPQLPSDFPRLRSLDYLPNNLPRYLTSFIGREREMEEVTQLLGSASLVTLTGVGGCGKTRLAVQIAAELAAGSKDGVWLVELAPLAETFQVQVQIAAALGVREEPGRTVIATLVDFLQDSSALLILDNCEHLVDACARIAEELLRRCPRLRILATSREALGVAGEIAWRVPSLETADSAQCGGIRAIEQLESVRLFADRVRSVAPRFALSPANAIAVAGLCSRLDGIPLALELAAARAKVLTVEQIAQRLDDRFRLLTGGSRTALPRQQTLRATIDWSYDLLTEKERAVLRRLSVFVGGCTLDAAEVVCNAKGIDSVEVLDLLSHLVDKSLVIAEEYPSGSRYRMLETVRQYSCERLLDEGEAEDVRARHGRWFADYAQKIQDRYYGPTWHTSHAEEDREMDNLRAALDWSVARGGGTNDALDLASGLCALCLSGGRLAEGMRYPQEALAVLNDNAAPPKVGRLLGLAAMLAWSAGYVSDCRQLAERSIEALTETNDPRDLVFAFGVLSMARRAHGDFEGMLSLNERRLTIARDSGDPVLIANALRGKASVLLASGDASAAKEVLVESLAHARRAGYDYGIAHALNGLGEQSRFLGEPGDAIGYYEESIQFFSRMDNKFGIQMVALNLGFCCAMNNDTERAAQLFCAALHLNRSSGNRTGLSLALVGVAGLLMGEGRCVAAARLLGAAQVLIDALGGEHQAQDRADVERLRERIRTSLNSEEYEAAIVEGTNLNRDKAICEALEQLAAVLDNSGSDAVNAITTEGQPQ